MMMNEEIQMATIFGDGSKPTGGGFMGKLFSAGKRILTGESLFMTAFTNIGTQKEHVSFAAPYSGKIIPMNLAELDGKIVCQKDSFLCSAKGVSIGIELQRKLGTGLFGGEGVHHAEIGGRRDGLRSCGRYDYRAGTGHW